MLKVTLNNGDNAVTLVLEGRLCGACCAEAERTWRSALANAGARQISIDLAGVSYVDRDGESLLQDMLEQGATVRVGGVWMEHLVADLRRRIVPTDSVVSRRTPRPHRSPGVS
jgi:ABC-type transporter Mla MlaB component